MPDRKPEGILDKTFEDILERMLENIPDRTPEPRKQESLTDIMLEQVLALDRKQEDALHRIV